MKRAGLIIAGALLALGLTAAPATAHPVSGCCWCCPPHPGK